jgi:hypothetical protein
MNLTVSTKYVCGIDLHAREMSACVKNIDGKVLMKRNVPCDIGIFMSYIELLKQTWTI